MSVHSLSLIRVVPAGALRAVAGQLLQHLLRMWQARRSRQMLGEMDDRMLADIGIGRGEALFEASRPMWDLECRPR